MNWVNAIIQGLLLGGLYALFACGLSLMFGVMKVINLAHGDLAVVAAYVALGLVAVTHTNTVSAVLHVPIGVSYALVVPIFALIGYVVQRTLLQASLNRGVLTTLLVTFGLSVVIENGLQQFLSANSHSLSIGSLVSDSFSVGSQITIAYLDLAILVVAVIVLLGLQYFLSSSKNGRLIRAVADDREAAQLAGVDYRHVFGIAAAIAFGTVALAGLAYGMYTQFTPTTGTDQLLLLFAFEAVVIGGLGSLWGTLAGGILLGVAQQIGAQIGSQDQFLVGQLLFLLVLVVRPQGITSRREAA
ncbi:MAG TPA: branched-chain amino acid ABC transporter permease [Streptosporangiaceae bacterium]|nr:branched-chain amino acid ABC transporter permease [Streptosporangiaceae bacterium]